MTLSVLRPGVLPALAPLFFVGLWSTGFIGAKFGLPYADPLIFLFYRYAIVTLLLGVILWVSRLALPRDPRLLAHLALSGLLLHGIYIGGVFIAIDLGTSSGIAALIVGLQPLLTALLAGPLLGEKVTRQQGGGFLLGFAGLSLTVGRTAAAGTLPLPGLASCLVALVAITLGTLYQKARVAEVDPRVGTFVQFMATAAGFGLACALFPPAPVIWDPRFVFALAWLCTALSLGATGLLWLLIRRGAAARVASLFYLVPPVTAVEGYLLFGERLGADQIAGLMLTAAGVALVNRR